jgi:virginiamycin B lyase
MIRSVLLATAAFASFASAAHAQQVEVQAVAGFADFIAVDGTSIWVTNRGRVEHWSRKGKLGEVPLARPCGAMAIMGDALWVANCGDGTLARIDRASAKLAVTIPTGIANQKEGELTPKPTR